MRPGLVAGSGERELGGPLVDRVVLDRLGGGLAGFADVVGDGEPGEDDRPGVDAAAEAGDVP